jgi:hypothetical protein
LKRVSREGELLGRDEELRALTRLLGHARNGQGGALPMSGSPGIGKTALSGQFPAGSRGARVLRADGFDPFEVGGKRSPELVKHLTPSHTAHQQEESHP